MTTHSVTGSAAYRQAAILLACLALATSAAAEPVLESANRRAAVDAASGRITFSSKIGDHYVPRAVVSVEGLSSFAACKPLAAAMPLAASAGPGLAVYGLADRHEFTLRSAGDGRFEFFPAASGKLVVHGARLDYAIAPSLVGVDFVYTAKADAAPQRLLVPSLGMLVGLVAGEESVMVAAWRPGKQAVSLHRGTADGRPVFDGVSLDAAGGPVWLGWIEHPRLWHVEPLLPTYLEKDTPIAWRRPLEAKWIGRFFVASEEMNYPFYFRHERVKLWGRWIRGWFHYPLWFDGEKTIVHFEKNFPPKGDLLIYFLDDAPAKRGAAPATSVGSPIGFLRKSLGDEAAAKLLDFDGVEERLLLKHGNAVCAMTNTMQEWFDKRQTALHRGQIETWCRDVSEFIGMIRRRVYEFDEYGKAMREFLARRVKDDPSLGDVQTAITPLLDEMDELLKSGMPKATLEAVRMWTVTMNRLADDKEPNAAKLYGKLGEQCRSVAGSQDDLCRDQSIRVIRATEEAARLGVQSPAHVQLAEEIIARSRQVLRKPTWWEPRRQYLPKSDPGRP